MFMSYPEFDTDNQSSGHAVTTGLVYTLVILVLVIAAYRRIRGLDDPSDQLERRRKSLYQEWDRQRFEQINAEQERRRNQMTQSGQ